jgi:hypothetical protein
MRSAVAFLLGGLITGPAAVGADEQVWALLKGGGQVVLIRHAITTPGVGDPPGMRLDDCRTQRNLTDEGRRDARRLGERFGARGIVVDRVLSSPWCRCLETARLAFGAGEVWQPLSNLFGRDEARAEQVRQMRALVGEMFHFPLGRQGVRGWPPPPGERVGVEYGHDNPRPRQR